MGMTGELILLLIHFKIVYIINGISPQFTTSAQAKFFDCISFVCLDSAHRYKKFYAGFQVPSTRGYGLPPQISSKTSLD